MSERAWIVSDLGWGDSNAGVTVSIFTMIITLLMLGVGSYAERFGLRKAIIAALVFTIAGRVLYSIAPEIGVPWVVAAAVPAVIYTIPVTSPLYYVTYIRVYGATAQVVYVGYTPGYLGTVVSPYGTVVYGTGYAYNPWVGSVWYAPPYTYGVYAAGAHEVVLEVIGPDKRPRPFTSLVNARAESRTWKTVASGTRVFGIASLGRLFDLLSSIEP